MTDKYAELRRLAEAFSITVGYSDEGIAPDILSLLDELEACRLLLKECDLVIQEDGGVCIELRAFLSGRMPPSEVIAIFGDAAMQEQKP